MQSDESTAQNEGEESAVYALFILHFALCAYSLVRVSGLITIGLSYPMRYSPPVETQIRRVDDFELDGTGSAGAWNSAEWLTVVPIKGIATHATQAKMVYSAAGVYCLFDCADHLLMSTALKDHADLWNEDVVEVFFWPDESQHLYLEYELSPLNAELVLMVPNNNGQFMGWIPWHYVGDRRCRHATTIRGGGKSPGAAIKGWTAEMFIPFALMLGLRNVPPVAGTKWRANFYRIDYDGNEQTLFAWSTGVANTFHDFKQFGTVCFT
jgi:hypothetical protein